MLLLLHYYIMLLLVLLLFLFESRDICPQFKQEQVLDSEAGSQWSINTKATVVPATLEWLDSIDIKGLHFCFVFFTMSDKRDSWCRY